MIKAVGCQTAFKDRKVNNMDMSRKAYNSPERKKRRDEGYRIFSDRTQEPTKEESLKRTPEQQRNDMFKTMNEASKKNEGEIELFKGITFTEIQDKVIKEDTKDGKIFQKMRELAEQMNKELCLLCDKPRDIDMKGFITIPDRDGKIYKVHYECVLKLIKEKLFG